MDRASRTQPSRNLAEHAWSCERYAVARRDQTGVAVRALRSDGVASFHEQDVDAATGELVRRRNPIAPAPTIRTSGARWDPAATSAA